MIGYYVHHVGRGHLHRAAALAATLDAPVTGLSSLPRPTGWAGDWIDLARDDEGGSGPDATAHGRLHWAPLHDSGLMARMADVSQWCAKARPELMVCDVSVEVALLARLHGIPVLSVVLPGDRTDRAHQSAFGISEALVSFWPDSARDMVRGIDPEVAGRWRRVGAMSRFAVQDSSPPTVAGPRRAVLLGGAGGVGVDADDIQRLRSQTPEWHWDVLGPGGTWVADPSPLLRDADVIVTHAGQNALAEVAAARRPAVIVPDDRPHDEQRTTARVVGEGPWPAIVGPALPSDGWAARLDRAAALDGAAWSSWCDGHAAERFARVVDDVRTRTRVQP